MEGIYLTSSLMLLLALGIASQWISSMMRIPAILLLLITGIVVGPITGLIDPEKILGPLLVPITSLSVAIILFEGGLSLHFREIKDVQHVIRNLVTIGMIAGFVITYLFLRYVLEFGDSLALLQSAILVISGPTVIKPMLSTLHLRAPTDAILKWEGIITDPFGAALAVIVFEVIIAQTGTQALEVVLLGVVKTLAIGGVFGGIAAYFTLYVIKNFWVPDHLHSPFTLMVVLLVFCASNFFQAESGLLTVTLMGVILGNQASTHIDHIIDFKENLTVILISFLFIVLAGIIDLPVLKESLAYASYLLIFLVLIARPFVVFCSGAFFHLSLRESLFLCCVAPKGIVTAVIASLFGIALTKIGYEDADRLAPITIAIICGTVTVYSLLAPLAAHFLDLSPLAKKMLVIIGANAVSRPIAERLIQEGYRVQLVDPNINNAMESIEETLPIYPGTFLEFEKTYPEVVEGADMILAMTESADINSLAVIYFRAHLDESKLYQFSGADIDESLQGRELFGKNFEHLSSLIKNGAKIKVVDVDEKGNPLQEGTPLFILHPKGGLTPFSKDTKSPSAGDQVMMVCNTEIV